MIHKIFNKLKSFRVRTVGKLTARYRTLPDFIIIGAQKAGTTSLYRYLEQHPQVFGSSKKEVHYFDHFYSNGELWYRSHFPLAASIRKNGGVTGEASPFYLFHPKCAQRIHERLPAVKLIAVLRNPIDRAISHYFMQVRKGHEKLRIGEAMHQEERRLAQELERLEVEPHHSSFSLGHYSYKSRGMYVDQLARYSALFPRDQLLVLKAEDLFTDTGASLREVYGFLGIDHEYLPKYLHPRNVGGYDKNVPTDVYEYLREFFQPYNERLYAYLGRRFDW